jgi:hypothetical protein
MIKDILDLLNASDWYGIGENIDIAKGKYAAVNSFEEMKEQLKRLKDGN